MFNFSFLSLNNEEKAVFGCFDGIHLFTGCQYCSALNQRCSEMLSYSKDIKIKSASTTLNIAENEQITESWLKIYETSTRVISCTSFKKKINRS